MRKRNGPIERGVRKRMQAAGYELVDFVTSRWENGETVRTIANEILEVTGSPVCTETVRYWLRNWGKHEPTVEVTAE